MMTGLEITEKVVGHGIVVIGLSGSLHEATVKLLEDAIRKHLDLGTPRFVIDCENLTYLNSKGVGAFNWAIGGIRARGGDIKFSRVKGKAKNIFDMLGLDEFIQICQSPEAAVKAFTDPNAKPLGAESLSYVTAKDSKYYHYSWCKEAKKLDQKTLIKVTSRLEFFGTEKLPCPVCRPADLA